MQPRVSTSLFLSAFPLSVPSVVQKGPSPLRFQLAHALTRQFPRSAGSVLVEAIRRIHGSSTSFAGALCAVRVEIRCEETLVAKGVKEPSDLGVLEETLDEQNIAEIYA